MICNNFCNNLGILNKLIIVKNSNFNNKIIAKQVTVYLKYLSYLVLVNNKQSYQLIMAANQVRFTIITKYITNKPSNTITVTIIDFVRDNSSGGRVGVISVTKVGIVPIINIGMSFDYNYNIDSNIKAGVGGDLRDIVVCLDTLSVMVIGLAFS